MSYTINQQPAVIAPAYNPMVFTVSSTNSANINYRFIYQITINGTTITVKQSPNPSGYGVLDIHRMIEDFLSYDFTDDALFQVNSNSFAKYSIDFGEEYGSTPVEHLALQGIANYYAFNASLPFLDWLKFDVTDYELADSTKKFLTYQERTQEIGLLQEGYLYWIYPNIAGTGNKKMSVKTYDSSGSLLATHVEVNADSPPTSLQYFGRFSVGTGALSGAGISFTNVAYYTVQMLDNSNVASSELFRFNISDLCTKYKVYRLHFLNKLGGFDALNFLLRDTINTDITRTTFEKIVGNFSGSSYSYDGSNHGTIQDNTTLNDTIQVNSNWITNTQAIWLKELFTSPAVFLEDATINPGTTFIPITITDTKYQTKKSVPGEKLFNVIINFSFAVQNSRQRF